MALQGWGSPISIYQIAVELGIGATGLSLNDSRVRTLLGNTSGAVYMSNAYGKSNNYSGTLTVGNRGTQSGCYRPNSSSGWSWGAMTPAAAFGVGIVYFLWDVDRYGNTSGGRIKFDASIGANVRFVFNGKSYTQMDSGGGLYGFPDDCVNYLENVVGVVQVQIYKA